MDCGLLSSQSEEEPKKGVGAAAPRLFSETCEEHFPYYLSIGMSEEQYWDRDCALVVAYRKADTMRQERENQYLWLQGRYVYEAIGRMAPILHAFAKKGTEPVPYLEEPYPITKQAAEDVRERKEKQNMERGRMMMQTFAASFNKKFNKQEGE